ncbi:hypothetical protein SLEP1_g47737 [Rubroshorea leprosula]|uniref:Uncharacterized protein n=1 Tax=Rubroshorea leprosula TaxID=152421 RepID=A0AAV5LTQ6_9ROSI|nr:hypothetical protein SLEP1_g47737 [Rubroshorea leprosula]
MHVLAMTHKSVAVSQVAFQRLFQVRLPDSFQAFTTLTR